MFSKRFVLGLAAVGAAMLAVNSAKALTMADLSAGGSITVGNLTFSNFTYGGTTPASSVVVASTAAGLEFSTSTGGWTTPDGSSVIGYDISITNDSIKTVNLSFQATATGSAVASVGETVTDKANKKDYSLQVSAGLGGTNLSDSVDLNPASNSLHVIKSIDVAASGNGTATITLVDNAFVPSGGEQPPGVPEPMSLALLPLAVAGLGLRRKLIA